MRLTRDLRLLSVLLASGVLLSGADASGPSLPAGGDILIGVSNAQTGRSSVLGKELTLGSQAYFDLINAHGGIRSHRLQMVIKDDGYEPDPAVSNTNALINQDRVLFLFDYVGTPTLTRVLPLLRYYESQTIVEVAPMTGADPQRRPPYDRYVFNVRASYADEAQALVAYLYGEGCRKFAFLGQADAYGKSGEVAVSEALRQRGLHILLAATYRRNIGAETDMSKQVTALRAAGADAVIAFGVYAPCAAFIRDARVSGWNVPIANVSFVGAFALLKELTALSGELHRDLTRNLINSEVVPSPDDKSRPLVEKFRNSVAPGDRSFTRLEGWLNAAVAVAGLERAGPEISRQSFVAGLQSLRGWDPGLGVPLDFSSSSHQALHTVWLTAARGSKWIPVGEVQPPHEQRHP